MDSQSSQPGTDEHKKRGLGITVLDAAQKRIKYVFDNFPKIYLSFSGGKDSTVMLHMVMEEAIKREKKIGVLFVDLEAQYKMTIEHVKKCFEMYEDFIESYWVAIPIYGMSNAVSMYNPEWCTWEPGLESRWVRQQDPMSITDTAIFPFYRDGIDFESFISEFGHWYGGDKLTACFVGIRSDESLNRWRTIAGHKKQTIDGHQWTTWCGSNLYNVYPVYDWKTQDIWIYHGKHPNKPYNKIYDRMYQAGLTIHQSRLCQPYGSDQRKGLWLYHVIEPETWGKIVARVNGANHGALYAQDTGNIMGVGKITLPDGHTWRSFAEMLLESLPPITAEHYRNKIAVFIRWHTEREYQGGLPDDGPMNKDAPSWKRICKALLRNDYWAKGLSFSPTKTQAYDKYVKLMKRRRQEWKLMI